MQLRAHPASSSAAARPRAEGHAGDGDVDVGVVGRRRARAWKVEIALKDSLGQLRDLLLRARAIARARWTLCAALSILGICLALGIALLALAARGVAWTRAAAIWLPLAGLATFAVAGPLAAHLRWRSLMDIARQIAPRLPTRALREGFLPAVELGERLAQGQPVEFSRSLAEAHIDALAAQIAPVRAAPLMPNRGLRYGLGALGIAAAAALFALVFFSQTLFDGARFLSASQPAAQQVAVSREPITGDIELTYRYPAYTRRADRVVANTSGEISAPLGTEVALRTRADRPVERASLVLEGAAGAVPLAVGEGRHLSGTIVLTGPGAYRFRFETHRGKVVAEGPPLPIAIEADAAPAIELVEPLADLEVDASAAVKLAFEAEDDFGIESVALLYKLPGAPTPRRVVLQREGDAPRRVSGEHDLELAPLGLMAGDTVAYYLEARDGDTMAGPKSGVTPTRFIKIYSRAEHHRQLLAMLEEDWEKLIHLLADRLEGADRRRERTPADLAQGRRLDASAMQLGLELQARALDLEKAALPEQLSAALSNIGQARHRQALDTSRARGALAAGMRHGQRGPAAQRRAFARTLQQEIGGIERDILYLEALLDQQRTADLVESAAELTAKQRQLAGLLEALRQSPDDETKARVLAEISRLKERMAELMRRMGELTRAIQDAHVNAEALRELSEAAKAMDAFDRMQDHLHRGEVEAAMKALDEIGGMLDTLQRQIEGASQELGSEADAALGRELRAFSADLDELTRAQEALLRETQQIREQQHARRQQALRARGEDFFDKLRAQVAQARERVDRVRPPSGFYGEEALKSTKTALDDLAMALEVEDLGRAGEFSEAATNKLQKLAREIDRQQRFFGWGAPPPTERDKSEERDVAEARAQIEAVSEAIGELQAEGSEALGEAERGELRGLAEREAALRQKAEALGQNMEALNESAPIFPDEARALMQQIGEQMAAAEGGLREESSSRAARSQRAALDRLGELKQGLRQQAEQGQGTQQQQAQGPRIPWPWGAPGRGVGQRSGSGQARLDHSEKVQVPKADSYQVPEAYRKEILDAMKERSPERYQEQVRRYYEEIIK